jgi:hypothetical protein
MRSMRLAAVALAVCLIPSLALAQKQIVLMATVTDPTGAEVTSVDPASVDFTEEGMPGKVLKVEALTTGVPKIQILLDNGNGIPKESLGDVRTAMKNLINALPAGVETTIVTTAPQPRMLQKATTDKGALLLSIDRLSPDDGSGRFVDAMFEATERIEKDKQEGVANTIFVISSNSGDLQIRDSDVNKTLQRIQQRRITVHMVLLNSSRTASSGGIQTDMGKTATGVSGGRFEAIAVPNRLITLLPEIGKQIAAATGPGSKQFRFTIERPAGAGANLGRVTFAISGKIPSNVGVAPAK